MSTQVEEQSRWCERSSRPLLTVNLIVCRPLIGKTVNLNVSLDLLATVQIETDPKSGASRMVMTECASDPDSISFTLLGE